MTYADAASLLLGAASPIDNTTAALSLATIRELRVWPIAKVRLVDGTQSATPLDGSVRVAGLGGSMNLHGTITHLLSSYTIRPNANTPALRSGHFDTLYSRELDVMMEMPGCRFQTDLSPVALRISITKNLFADHTGLPPTWSANIDVMFGGGDHAILQFNSDGTLLGPLEPDQMARRSKAKTGLLEPNAIHAVVACIRDTATTYEGEGNQNE